jgi:hypothetical protein
VRDHEEQLAEHEAPAEAVATTVGEDTQIAPPPQEG